MPLAELAALGAATCWSMSSLLSVKPVKTLGALGFVRIRMWLVVLMLSAYLLLRGEFTNAVLSISNHDMLILAVSGIIGIWFGDVMLFLTVDRLGPRRTAILFATNAPMQVLLGVVFFGESMNTTQIAGCALVMTGAYCAIVFGNRATQSHQWEAITGLLIVGVVFGLLTALGQAVGALIAKPVMDKGISPEAAVIIRGLAALAVFVLCLRLPIPNQHLKNPLTLPILAQTGLGALLGMALGMSLLLYAMGNGDLGKVAILSALSPVIMLPLLWIKTRERPAFGAWIGACLAVLGIVLLR